MLAEAPLNLKLLDVDNFIKQHGVKQVTTLSIYEPSSFIYCVTGLFSENIFGAVGSTDRMINYGYISLNTNILQPHVYKNVIKLATLYEEIISGSAHAIFDHETKDFIRCTSPTKHPECGTGYTFFMSKFHEIEFHRNDSTTRSDRISIIEKYKDILFCDKIIVLPAGLRDLEESQGTITTDDINKLYQTILSYSFSIPPGARSTIYDSVRYSIQRKVVEVYDYIENILSGKRGFIQGAWGNRRVALGTRNVITAATYATMTPNDPQVIQPDETKLGLFQTMKALQPIVVHYVRTVFIEPIFGHEATIVPLIDPATLELVYRELSSQETAKFQNPDAIEDLISKFQNIDIRTCPITVHCDEDDKDYFLLMIYDDGDEISLFRSLTEFVRVSSKDIDHKKIRPLTWTEMFYMATANAAVNKHVFITRYPVIQDESCYPTKIHLCTTVPSRVVKLINPSDDQVILTYPEYPILGRAFLDSVQLAASRLKGLGGDFDGDTVSANAVLSIEANDEVHKFLGSIQSVVNSQKELLIGSRDDLISYFCLSASRL